MSSCSREPHTVEWIEQQFRDGDVFYGVGANIGAYSLITAKQFAGQAKVYAFEPCAINFGQLVRNLNLNGCAGVVTPFPVALAEMTRIDVFNYHNLVSGAALHQLGGPTDGESVSALRLPIIVCSLDELIAKFRLLKPSHINVDVDRSEPAVLAGARDTLGSMSLRCVLIEVPPDEDAKCLIGAMLTDRGFSLAARHPLEAGSANLLFVGKAQ